MCVLQDSCRGSEKRKEKSKSCPGKLSFLDIKAIPTCHQYQNVPTEGLKWHKPLLQTWAPLNPFPPRPLNPSSKFLRIFFKAFFCERKFFVYNLFLPSKRHSNLCALGMELCVNRWRRASLNILFKKTSK